MVVPVCPEGEEFSSLSAAGDWVEREVVPHSVGGPL